MATLVLANTFTALTTAESSEVNENFNDIVSFVNTKVAHLDGSLAFEGIPSGPAEDPTSDNQLARKLYVDNQVKDAGNITSGTLAVARGGTGKSSVTAGRYLKGNGTSAMAEATAANIVQEGRGLRTSDAGRVTTYGVSTLSWTGSTLSIAHTMDFEGINAIVVTPHGGDFGMYIESYASNSVTLRGTRFSAFTGNGQFSYIAIHQG